jgi:hypothetical protein
MNRRASLVAIAVVASLVVAGAGRAATTLKLVTVETSSDATETRFRVTEDLFQNGKKIGTDRIVCKQASRADLITICRITYFLPAGTLLASVRLSVSDAARDRIVLTVTGGTGDYANATGAGSIRDLPGKGRDKTTVTLHLD